jgi:hypothetical protein
MKFIPLVLNQVQISNYPSENNGDTENRHRLGIHNFARALPNHVSLLLSESNNELLNTYTPKWPISDYRTTRNL